MANLNYFERKEIIEKLFGNDFSEKYPLSSRILDRHIRCKINYGEKETQNIILSYQHNKGLVGIVKNLAYLLLVLIIKKDDKEKILVSPSLFSRFEFLGEQLKGKYNISSVLNKNFSMQLLKIGVKNLINTDEIVYSQKLQKLLPEITVSISQYIDDSTGFSKKILFPKLDALENILNEEVNKLSQIFIKRKVKLYLSVFDQVYDDTFNIVACQKVGIKTKCIAHAFLAGSIEKEPKTNCLPVLADKLYVWSQEDYDLLKGYEKIEKIEIGGYPKFTKGYIEEKKKEYLEKKIITFFSGYRFSDEWLKIEAPIRKKLFSILKEIAEEQGYEICIRYQGRDEETVRGEKKLLGECHIKISRNPFLKDILQSEISLGFDTSCLYEAKIMGKKAYTLFTHTEYDEIFFMKNIEYIDAGDIKRKLNEKIDIKSRYDLLLNLDQIINS